MGERDEQGRTRVVAAVLRDRRGRILLTRRGDGRSFAGSWEFPGGKVEPGESATAALARELHEELGITIATDRLTALIAVPCSHGGKRIVLDVFEVPAWRGRARGREGQALAWTALERLGEYTVPPADLPVVAALRAPSLYLITPEPDPAATGDRSDFLRRFEAALAAGRRRIQLRARALRGEPLALLAARCLARCREVGAELLVNGDVELARELGCGVHLRADQLLGLGSRPLPPEQPVAASCHDGDELARAEALGLDFAVLGPVRITSSHPGSHPIGWHGFARLREPVSLPVYALGGMGPDDVALARRHGGQGVAGIRAFWPAAERER